MKRTFTTDATALIATTVVACAVYGTWATHFEGGPSALLQWGFSGIGAIWQVVAFLALGLAPVARGARPYYRKTNDLGGALAHALPDMAIVAVIGAMATQLGWLQWSSALVTVPLLLLPAIGCALLGATLYGLLVRRR